MLNETRAKGIFWLVVSVLLVVVVAYLMLSDRGGEINISGVGSVRIDSRDDDNQPYPREGEVSIAPVPKTEITNQSKGQAYDSVPSDVYPTLVPVGEANRITDLYQDWQKHKAPGGDPDMVWLAEMEIRETVAKYQERLGEDGNEAHKMDFHAVIATAKRIRLIRE